MTEMNEGFFDDIAEDMPIEDEVEEMTDETETPDESVEQAPEEPFLRIKYDKEELGLTREEAIDLAEKGKNYDRLRDRYNALNEPLEQLARLYDMDVPSFLNSLSESQTRFEVSKELQSLREMYPNADEEVLTELATKRVGDRTSLQERRYAEEQTKAQDAQEAEIKRQLGLFRQEYPNLEPDKLDREVYDYVKQGYTLLEAYNKWARGVEAKNKPAMESKLRAEQLNESNRAKSLGNTTNAGSMDIDDFLAGWNS